MFSIIFNKKILVSFLIIFSKNIIDDIIIKYKLKNLSETISLSLEILKNMKKIICYQLYFLLF